jgi:lactoylglutathione lyase
LGAQASALVKRGSLNGLDDVIWFIDKVYWGAAIRIEHVATWTGRLDQLKEFYVTYFGAEASSKYVNPDKNFESYFLSFSTGARLELMQSPGVADQPVSLEVNPVGYAHLAFSVGSKEQVDSLTTQLRTDGYQVVSTPRFTGDGYYESVVLDPDGNRIEITI